jgi:hypothetical protein
MPQLRAVREGRVHIASQWWAQLPTQHVGELGDLFSLALNEARSTPGAERQRRPGPFDLKNIHPRAMKRFGALQLVLQILFSVALWAVVAAGCMMVSSVSTGWPSDPEIFRIRSEVVLMSSLVGAALGAAGATYQPCCATRWPIRTF